MSPEGTISKTDRFPHHVSSPSCRPLSTPSTPQDTRPQDPSTSPAYPAHSADLRSRGLVLRHLLHRPAPHNSGCCNVLLARRGRMGKVTRSCTATMQTARPDRGNTQQPPEQDYQTSIMGNSLQLPLIAHVLAILGGIFRRLENDNLAAFKELGVQSSAGINVSRTCARSHTERINERSGGAAVYYCSARRRSFERLRTPPQHGLVLVLVPKVMFYSTKTESGSSRHPQYKRAIADK